ncbi:nucleoid-associated protein [Acinetobacter guillouiae]|uniref:nucleoid-associated protein n=1 Tax=Acinetobacter guillouiae TaxID=106649 RepID=UPI0028D2069B|nr:nucleoid-associated protein [Acinetobacter guillouiae]
MNSPFIKFSHDISTLITLELAKATMGTGGFVLILNYIHSETEWLMIIMLKNDEGYGLSELLTLEKRKYLNIKRLNESARINVNQWLTNTSLPNEEKKSCLSFMKGKKDEDVTEYFRDALGCVGYHSSNKNTKEVIKAITTYMEKNEYLAVTRDNVRISIHEYFTQQYNNDLEVDLETISRKVDTDYPSDFIEYLRENNINIDSSFKPSQKSFKNLQKLSFTIGDVRVSFSYDDINETISLSDQGLLIKTVPPHIIQEMDSYKPRTTQITMQNPDE